MVKAQTFTGNGKTEFKKEETMRMVFFGTSVIEGQIFAKDYPGGSVLNMNKRQYAPIGTEVLLVPYTAYFKEYIAVLKRAQKQGKTVQLPEDALKCIKVAIILDEQGHYKFSNLTNGEYLLLTNFDYKHTTTTRETVGRKEMYVGGIYQGSSPITSIYSQSSYDSAAIEEVVSINVDGEVKKINLKKT